MSSAQLDIASLHSLFTLKLKELKSVFRMQFELQGRKDSILQKELAVLKVQLIELEKSLHLKEIDKKKLLESLCGNEKEIFNLNEKFQKQEKEAFSLKEEIHEKSREINIANDKIKNSERRIESMKVELSGYLTKLNETKKSLQEAQGEIAQYFSMYNRVNKMFHQATEEIDLLKEEFESRNSLQEEFIQALLSTLKRNGIDEFELDDEVNETESKSPESSRNEEKENEESVEECKELEEVKPPLRIYPWWRPSKSLTTIMEEDEVCEADDEREKLADSAFDSDHPSSFAILNNPPKFPPAFPSTKSIYEVKVQKPAEVVIMIESDGDEMEQISKVDIAIQNDLDAEENALKVSEPAVNSTPSETSFNATDDGKMKKKKRTRAKKNKNTESKSQVSQDEKVKSKKVKYVKVLTVGCY